MINEKNSKIVIEKQNKTKYNKLPEILGPPCSGLHCLFTVILKTLLVYS